MSDSALPPNIRAILKHAAPASLLLGLQIEDFDVEAAQVRVSFEATGALLNKLGSVQGGMLAAMLDEAMSLAVGLSLDWGQISPTLEIKVNFIKPAKAGRISGIGRVVRRGKSVAFLEGELLDDAGVLVATGSATATIGQLRR